MKKIYKTLIIYISSIIAFISILTSFSFYMDGDESFSLGVVGHKFLTLIDLDACDVHPPLYYVLLKIFINLFTFWTKSMFIKILAARLFSLLTVVLSIYFLRKLLMLFHITVNKYGIILYMILPGVLLFSTRIRMYSLASLFLSMSLYGLTKFYFTRDNRFISLFILGSICTIYTLYGAAISLGIYVVCYICLFLYHRDYKSIKKLILSISFISISYIPWLPILFRQMEYHSKTDYGGNLSIKIIVKAILMAITQFNSGYKIPIFSFILCILVILLIYLSFSKKFIPLNGFQIIFSISLINILLTTIISFILCRNKFQPIIVYPIFTLCYFMIMAIISTTFNYKNRIFQTINIIIVLIFMIVSSENIITNIKDTDIPSISLIKHFKNWKQDGNTIYVNMNKYPNNSIIYDRYAQNSLYIKSLNKREVLQHTHYKYLSKYITNNYSNIKLTKSVLNNLKINNK